MSAHTWIPFRNDEDRERHAARVAVYLRDGGLVAHPTETVYGLGCALRPDALARLAWLKRRGAPRPFLLLVRDAWDAPGLEWTEEAERLAGAFWPGPLTLVLRVTGGNYPPEVTGEGGTVAIRASPHPAVRAVLRELGEPITSTSANLPGEPPASTAEDVGAVLEALAPGEPVWILDAGPLPPSPPSTVLAVTGGRPRLLRAGAVSVDELRKVVGEIDELG